MTKNKQNNSSTTVLTIVVGFAVIFWITKMEWALYVAISVGVLGILSSWLRDQIDFLWGLLAKVLSYIVPNILLSLIFYFFLTPVAFLSKIFGKKDPLKLKNKSDSVYVVEEKTFAPESFEKIF